MIVEFLHLGLVLFLDPLRFRPFLKRPPRLCPALLRGFGAHSQARDARSRVRDPAAGIPVGSVDAEPGAPAVLEPLARNDCQTACVHKSSFKNEDTMFPGKRNNVLAKFQPMLAASSVVV